MQVVHTAGVPPNQGKIRLPSINWTMNNRKADRKVVAMVTACLMR